MALGFTVRAADGAGGLDIVLAAVPAGDRVAIVDPRFTGHRHSLRLALTDPRFDAAAIPGAITTRPAARGALVGALRQVVAEMPVAAGTAATAPRPESLPDRIAGHLGARTDVYRPELGALVATVPATTPAREEAVTAMAAVDEEAVRLRSAVKSRDGFFTTYGISPYSRYLARWCARRGLTPNQVTTASLLTAVIAAGCAATGTRTGFVGAGLLLLFSFVLDCADGQLARYSLQYSTLGAWLDATFDRAKEYAYYAGLALGAARGGEDIWALALAAMILQSCRHMVDFAFVEAGHAGDSGPVAALSGRLNQAGWTVWARRMVVLPIGERWLLIAVFTALTTPRTTLIVLLAAGGLAFCYTTAGRLLRSRHSGAGTASSAVALGDLADTGPLAAALSRPYAGPARRGTLTAPLWTLAGAGLLLAVLVLSPGAGGGWAVVAAAALYALCAGRAVAAPLLQPLDWLLPPVFRAVEYSVVLLLAAHSEADGALPAAFGLVAAYAYHHYDTVYRLRGGAGASPRWLVMAAGGQEGRTLVVTVAAALWATGQGFTLALVVLAGALASLVLTESIRFWISSQAPAVHDESGEPA